MLAFVGSLPRRLCSALRIGVSVVAAVVTPAWAQLTPLYPVVAPAHPAAMEEVITIRTVDDHPLNLLIARPKEATTPVPMVVQIDGSGCYSAWWTMVKPAFRLPDAWAPRMASLIVDKPGMSVGQGVPPACPEAFLQRYSMDLRLIDHLRALQYLRRHASWWNGELYIWGFSDGGSIGAELAAYWPDVKRVALGGFAGGRSMRQDLMEILCREVSKAARPRCEEGLARQFVAMRRNPTPQEVWQGPDNSHLAWASRLDRIEVNVLRDLRAPLLIVHGAKDIDNAPVASARSAVAPLQAAPGTNVTYWEIPNMWHTLSTMPPPRRLVVQEAIWNWLFDVKPVGPGGPPGFGLPNP